VQKIVIIFGRDYLADYSNVAQIPFKIINSDYDYNESVSTKN
jgi:hypothetical protein